MDIVCQPPIPLGPPPFILSVFQFSHSLLFLAGFNFRGHFEGLNEGFSISRFLTMSKGMIKPPK